MASPRHWPGSSSTKAPLTGRPIEGLWFDRTREHKARKQGKGYGKFDFAEEETLALSPLPVHGLGRLARGRCEVSS